MTSVAEWHSSKCWSFPRSWLLGAVQVELEADAEAALLVCPRSPALVSANPKAQESVSNVITLQRAQVQNERLKLNARKEAGAVHTALKKLKQQVHEEIGKNHPEVAKEIIKIADTIEKETEKS